jgi:hypothetical protein
MKKLFVFFAALAISGGMLFAQAPVNRIANITEKGINHQATVYQTGPGFIRADVVQEKAFNTAKIDQINLHNMSGALIVSKVAQTGIGNEATVKQTHNGIAPFILNTVIDQSGNKNKADQTQGPDQNHILGPLNATITQSGNDNTASQTQFKAFNDASILQSGNHNIADQKQFGMNLEADIIQSGNGNNASQEQYGMNNKAYANQSGNGNNASQEQYGMNNKAYANQSGDGNISTQIQREFSSSSYASVLQKGNLGTAIQDQTGSWNKAEIEQGTNSFGNYAKQTQVSDGQFTFGNYVNKAEIYQDGLGPNYAEQIQTNMFNVIPNEAAIAQLGSMNYASQTQYGGSNQSAISQTGTFNHAVVIQTPLIP